MVQTEIFLSIDSGINILSMLAILNEVSEYYELVVAVRYKTKVELHRLIRILNDNHTILNWLGRYNLVTICICSYVVHLQRVTKVYLAPISLVVVNSTEGTIL